MVTEFHKNGALSNMLKRNGFARNVSLGTRLQLSVDYVRVIDFLHHSPVGTRVMCDTHNLYKAMSQFLITDDFHVVVNDLDNLPRVDRMEGRLIKCTRSSEIHTMFVAPEQKWPDSTRPYNHTQMLPYDEKTDIWKIPPVINTLLGNTRGSSAIKTRLSHVLQSCRKIDPARRPGAREVLRALVEIQESTSDECGVDSGAAACVTAKAH